MTVRQLLAAIGADELAEWQAIYRNEPWGMVGVEQQLAVIAWLLYHANKKKGAPDRQVGDFLAKFGGGGGGGEGEDGRPTPRELKAKLMNVTAALGGSLNGKRGQEGTTTS